MKRRKLITILTLSIILFLCLVKVTTVFLYSPATQHKLPSKRLWQAPKESGRKHAEPEREDKSPHPVNNYNPIVLKGAHDLVIADKNIKGGADACITLIDCYNIKIINSTLTNSSKPGIYLFNCTNI